MPGAVPAVFVAELVDDGGGEGRAQQGGRPGGFVDLEPKGVAIVVFMFGGVFVVFVFFGAARGGFGERDFDEFSIGFGGGGRARSVVGVEDVALAAVGAVGEGLQFFNDAVARAAVNCELGDEADGGEWDGEA